tara:strand:+ start:4084 stop:4272 length:189 start_codon:yes stop_codon:yes gene_type:complete
LPLGRALYTIAGRDQQRGKSAFFRIGPLQHEKPGVWDALAPRLDMRSGFSCGQQFKTNNLGK